MNNKFELFISGQEYTELISYPFEVVQKNLNDSFNTYTITLNRTNIAEPFVPNQKIEIQWFDGETVYKSVYGLLLSDAVEKIGVTNFYKHNLNLIDYAYYLEMINLPDMTITRLEGVYEPTLADVANRILQIASFEVSNSNTALNINLSTEASNALGAVLSPEWTFNRMTAFEALRMVFNYIKLTPVMTTFTQLGFVGASLEEVDSSKVAKFGGFTEAHNPTSYRTRLVSSVSNFIAGDEEEGAIIEPAEGFITPRSPDGFEISNDNLLIPTSRPIYKIENLEIPRYLVIGAFNADTTQYHIITVPESLIPQSWFRFDINPQDFLYEKSVYDTLPNTANFGARGGSFYYEQGKNNIEGLSSRSPSKYTWFPNSQAFKVVFEEIRQNMIDLSYTIEVPGRYIKDDFEQQAEVIAVNYWESLFGPIAPNLKSFGVSYVPLLVGHPNQNNTSFIGSQNGLDNVNHDDITFRITYIPYTETMLYTYRERKTNNNELMTTQYYNQQANVVSSSVLAELHDRVSKSNSGSSRDLMFVHRSIDELIPVSHRFGDYIITQSSSQIFPQSIISHYDFDKFFLKLNTYVAVLEKWRQFAIPSENIVRRQITINKFAKFSTTPSSDSAGINENMYLEQNNELRVLRMARPGTTGVYMPITNFAFNNAMVWEGFLQNNVSAGIKSEVFDSNKRIDRPHLYTDINGRFNSTITLRFATKFDNQMTLEQSFNLPISPAVTNTNNIFLGQTTPTISKDAREALSFSLQLHHIDTTGKVYINDLFAKYNGLIGGPGINHFTNRRIVFLNKPMYDKKEAVLNVDTVGIVANPIFSINNGSVVIPPYQLNSPNNAAAWAFAQYDGTDKYKILFWVNEPVNTGDQTIPLYINFDNTY